MNAKPSALAAVPIRVCPEPVPTGENLLHWPRDGGPRKRAVVFVHGFKGDKVKTWTGPNGVSMFSLVWMDASLSDVDVLSFGYRTGFGLGMPPIATLSRQLQNELVRLSTTYEQVVVCAHSLGGIISMRAIVDALNANRKINLPGLILYGTPLEGSGLVNLAQIVFKLGSLKTMFLVPLHFLLSRKGSQFDDLRKGSDMLFELRAAWARHIVNGGDLNLPASQRADCAIRVASGTDDSIVSEQSAKTFFGECDWCPLDFGHVALVKPSGDTSGSYLVLREFLAATRSHSSVAVRRRLREISETILNYRQSKFISNWVYEVKFLDKNVEQPGSPSLFENSLFATTRVMTCRYETVLTRRQIDIVFAFGSTAEDQAWRADPSYVHFIHVDRVAQHEKERIAEALARAFELVVPDSQESSAALFRNLSVGVQKKGEETVHRLATMRLVKFSQAVVCQFELDASCSLFVGSEVVLHLSFDSVGPCSISSFTMGFPWLTIGVSGTFDVVSEDDVSIDNHLFPSESLSLRVENLGNVKRVHVRSDDLVLPDSFFRVSWQRRA